MYIITKKPKTPNMIWDAKTNSVVVKFDEEGVFKTADKALAKKMKELGHTVEGLKEIDDMTIEELKDYAAALNIELGEAIKKADILAVIKNAG